MPAPSRHAIVHVRQRTWLVNDVLPHGATHTVRLACLDDDDAGRAFDLIWEAELDAAVLHDEAAPAREPDRLDPPRTFAAFLRTTRWNLVTSTDAALLQAPFRAGIDLKHWQLEPLRKALALPRVNLFIADDVGLGKTIEAGLVLTELLLRQRVDRVLVIAPPAVTRQWRQELLERFGLDLAVYDAGFVADRRRERGWATNAWTTHRRFIVSTSLLRQRAGARRTSHLQALRQALQGAVDGSGRVARSLLIVDEAHHVAPSGDGAWATDSATTAAVREIAGFFEHKLFLSATPHNGHPRSFAHLLHLLDDQRFLRGVPIEGPAELAPVMVRRLKRDLRGIAPGMFPHRAPPVDHVVRQAPDDPELELARLLSRYDAAFRRCLAGLPASEQRQRALVLVTLHKRLLSSIPAFLHTLEAHLRGWVPAPPADEGDLDAEQDAEDAAASGADTLLDDDARALAQAMRALAARHAARPDGRIAALVAWIREHLTRDGRWGTERLLVFTEYEHTRAWLERGLRAGLAAAPRLDLTGRLQSLTGRTADEARARLQRDFNADPATTPLRVLLCTDAAREGINLQGACRHVWHFDLPWNPGRIEQRNGRIDRVLQPFPEVFCHHFDLPDRADDKVVRYLLRKVEAIVHDLGSLSAVLSDAVTERLARGARDLTRAEADALATPDAAASRAAAVLEAADAVALRGDLDALAAQLDASARRIAWDRDQLRDAVDTALTALCGSGLTPIPPVDGVAAYTLPPLDASWASVVDPIRERPDPDRPFEVPPIRPVSFTAPHRLDAAVVQLHLGHPLVRRLLGRFRAHGYGDGLARVTAVSTPDQHLRRALLIGRLACFGHGATRLHEELVLCAATLTADGVVLRDDADAVLADLDRALGRPDAAVAPGWHDTLRALTPVCRGTMDGPLRAAAARAEAAARAALAARGEAEARAMAALLEGQVARIDAELARPDLPAADRRALERRRRGLVTDLDGEPGRIRDGYGVALSRVEVVGLAFLWPAS